MAPLHTASSSENEATRDLGSMMTNPVRGASHERLGSPLPILPVLAFPLILSQSLSRSTLNSGLSSTTHIIGQPDPPLHRLQERIRPFLVLVQPRRQRQAEGLGRVGNRGDQGLQVRVQRAQLGVEKRPVRLQLHTDARERLEGGGGLLDACLGLGPEVADADFDLEGSEWERSVSQLPCEMFFIAGQWEGA